MKNKYTSQRYILRSNEVKNMEEVIQVEGELKDRVFDLAYNWYLKPIRSTSEEKLYKWG